jgi:hypothetical protein
MQSRLCIIDRGYTGIGKEVLCMDECRGGAPHPPFPHLPLPHIIPMLIPVVIQQRRHCIGLLVLYYCSTRTMCVSDLSGTVQDYDKLPVQFNGFCPVALLSGGEFHTVLLFPSPVTPSGKKEVQILPLGGFHFILFWNFNRNQTENDKYWQKILFFAIHVEIFKQIGTGPILREA